MSDCSKLYSFLCALNCAPLATSIGHWIELKSTDHIDGLSAPKKGNGDFKLVLLKDFHLDEAASSFSLTVFEAQSRQMDTVKDLKRYHDFRSSDERTGYRGGHCLELSQSLVVKVIQLFKQVLCNTVDKGSLFENVGEATLPATGGPLVSGLSPLKQRLGRYELMHIERKREVRVYFCFVVRK